jgi:hypothetical protein
MFRSGRTRPTHARSSGSEMLLHTRSLVGSIIDTRESSFRKRQGRPSSLESGQPVLGPTGSGKNPMENGRRQPSRDGTSRMMREYQVRICERLGGEIPRAYSAPNKVPRKRDKRTSCLPELALLEAFWHLRTSNQYEPGGSSVTKRRRRLLFRVAFRFLRQTQPKSCLVGPSGRFSI